MLTPSFIQIVREYLGIPHPSDIHLLLMIIGGFAILAAFISILVLSLFWME